MELDRALELAMVSSWGDLVKPGENSSVRVEYENLSGSPLHSLEVWSIGNRGYGLLVCRYSLVPADTASTVSESAQIQFANAFRSKTLADAIDFIMRNQGRFSRHVGGSLHGWVQLRGRPSEEERNDAATWSQTVRTEFASAALN